MLSRDFGRDFGRGFIGFEARGESLSQMRAGQLYEQKYIILRSVTVRRDLRCLSEGRRGPVGQVCDQTQGVWWFEVRQ